MVFHGTTTMSLPANVLVISLALILMPAAVLAVALSYVSFWLAHLPALVAGYSLAVLTGTISLINHFRISDVRPAAATLLFACVAVFAFGMALILARRRLLLAWLGVAGLLASAIGIMMAPPKMQWRSGVLKITAMDMGQGDALLLITPEGKSVQLDSRGLGGQSHSDFDVGIANFRPQKLWHGLDSPSPEFVELAASAGAFGVVLKPHIAGEGFVSGSVQIRVLNPHPGTEGSNPAQDEESMVLRLPYHNTSALLVGDSHRRTEQVLEGGNPQSNLLKIGHHGSTTSHSKEFLQAVAPQFAVVSAGCCHSFRHPRPEVMRR